MPKKGYSKKARLSAATARKIKNRLGQAAYENYKRTGVIPAGLDTTPSRLSADIDALKGYQRGWLGEAGFAAVNQSLRYPSSPSTPGTKRAVHSIDRLMSQHKLPSAMTVYRGSIGDKVPEVGQTIQDKAFLSTTPKPEVASGFASSEAPGYDVLYQIGLPAGQPALRMNDLSQVPEWADQDEILLPRDLPFQVLSVETLPRSQFLGGKETVVENDPDTKRVVDPNSTVTVVRMKKAAPSTEVWPADDTGASPNDYEIHEPDSALGQLLHDRLGAMGISVDTVLLRGKKEYYQDQERLSQIELDKVVDFDHLKEQVPEYIPASAEHFNPRSKKHIEGYLKAHGERKKPYGYTHSINDQNLKKKLPPEVYKWVAKTKQMRKYWSDMNTLLESVHDDGKIHPEWVEAASGRFYTGKPSIQTLSAPVRSAIVPSPGHKFYVADWSQQELRITATLAGEPALLHAFETGEDPHGLAYTKATGETLSDDQYTREQQRSIGKMLNYAMIYGINASQLSSKLGNTPDEAQALIDGYFAAFPHLKGFIEKLHKEGDQNGYATTITGRQIPVSFEPRSDDEKSIRLAYEKRDRQSANYALQGSGADQLVDTLAKIEDAGLLPYVRATMHDAFLLELPDEDPSAAKKVIDLMELPFHGVKPKAHISEPATNWAEAMGFTDPDPLADVG